MPRLQVQLERGSYAPGETVRGRVRALEGGKSRAGMAVLRYVERTDDYTEIAWEKMDRLWDGELADGASFSFEIALPADAKPGYRTENGSLAWEAFVRSDEFGRDTTVTQEFELTPPPGGYPEPSLPAVPDTGSAWLGRIALGGIALGAGIGYLAAGLIGAAAGAVLVGSGTVLEWRRRAKHFEVECPDRVRRGERARITVRMGDAGGVEGELEAELQCVERYDYRSYASRSSSRETKEETLHSERVSLGAAQRWAEIEVPKDKPFSHLGGCLSYEWRAIVREQRAHRLDRIAERTFEVLP